MSEVAGIVVAVLLSVAGLAAVARVVRRGTVADRTVGLDLLVIVLAAGIMVDAARTGDTVFLPVVTVVSLLAFVATVTIARFLESGNPPVDPDHRVDEVPATEEP